MRGYSKVIWWTACVLCSLGAPVVKNWTRAEGQASRPPVSPTHPHPLPHPQHTHTLHPRPPSPSLLPHDSVVGRKGLRSKHKVLLMNLLRHFVEGQLRVDVSTTDVSTAHMVFTPHSKPSEVSAGPQHPPL